LAGETPAAGPESTVACFARSVSRLEKRFATFEPEKDRDVETMRTPLRKNIAVAICSLMLTFSLPVERCFAQDQAETTAAPTKVAKLHEPAEGAPAADTGAAANTTPSRAAEPAEPGVPPAVARELEAMKLRILQLETELKGRAASDQPPAVANSAMANGSEAPAAPVAPAPTSATMSNSVASPPSPQEATPAAPAPAPEVDNVTPFAYADWTWLNGNARNKDAVWDSKFFTPEIRFDTNFVSSLNHPKDDSLGGSTEIFRSNEVQLEQISFGGDFHWQNVRGRVLTLGGMFAVTTPRNDASVGRGQWDLRGAYRYFGEAYGGYHFNVNHGLNIDAGIFVSYIGLFSYYNFDNWAYQPSYVSSNTPWFFNGLRIQWFPTNKLKIEPWIINGWQSYGRFGGTPGLGGQILYRPKPWLSLVFNNYGMGEDTLGNIGRSRIHTDDSVEVKYYDRPDKTLDKMAFSVTGDLGCEYGAGVSCHGDKRDASGTITAHKQSFAGWMLYNRWWFKKDTYGLTVGGGVVDNPGRYLVLLPPINGADAVSGSPYFTYNPGDPYKAWDASVTWDWMPKQYITFRWEYGYRHANVPYFTGRGGITPPGGNNGNPAVPVILSDGSTWQPDLRKDEASIRLAIMVKF
jgi:hypothetical protein